MSRPGFTPRVRFSFHVDVYSNVCKEPDLLPSGPPAGVNGLTFGFALTAALKWRDLTGQRARSTLSGSHANVVVAPFQVGRSTLIPSSLHLSKRSWCVCRVGDVVSWVTHPPSPRPQFGIAAVITTSPSHRDRGSALAVAPRVADPHPLFLPCLDSAAQTRVESCRRAISQSPPQPSKAWESRRGSRGNVSHFKKLSAAIKYCISLHPGRMQDTP